MKTKNDCYAKLSFFTSDLGPIEKGQGLTWTLFVGNLAWWTWTLLRLITVYVQEYVLQISYIPDIGLHSESVTLV